MDMLQMCARDVDALFAAVACAVTPPPQSALQLLRAQQQRGNVHALTLGATTTGTTTTSVSALALRFPPSFITEIVGPAGVGKTQACLSLAAHACVPVAFGGLGGTVAYVDTENAFSPSRLVEVALHRFPRYFAHDCDPFSDDDVVDGDGGGDVGVDDGAAASRSKGGDSSSNSSTRPVTAADRASRTAEAALTPLERSMRRADKLTNDVCVFAARGVMSAPELCATVRSLDATSRRGRVL
jgi:hypothetical protein